MTANLLDHLQEAGYMPDDDPQHIGDWYDLVVSGIGAVRAVLTPEDGAQVFGFDKFAACEWSARFSDNTPAAVVVGALKAAEWALAAKRGGPVTPAQAASAR